MPEPQADKISKPEFRRDEAAVDSELAWLPLIKMKVPLAGPLPNLLYGCTNRSPALAAQRPAAGVAAGRTDAGNRQRPGGQGAGRRERRLLGPRLF